MLIRLTRVVHPRERTLPSRSTLTRLHQKGAEWPQSIVWLQAGIGDNVAAQSQNPTVRKGTPSHVLLFVSRKLYVRCVVSVGQEAPEPSPGDQRLRRKARRPCRGWLAVVWRS